jgi:hypothetical protein
VGDSNQQGVVGRLDQPPDELDLAAGQDLERQIGSGAAARVSGQLT